MSLPKALESHKPPPLQPLAWEEIREPGAYVELTTGMLYRFPPEAVSSHSSLPLVEQGSVLGSKLVRVNRKPPADTQFVQVSKNPFIFSLGARMICVEHDIQPNF